ncbi:MAG: hypothetical protein WCG27_01210 [Pseudomonadota bacterium]
MKNSLNHHAPCTLTRQVLKCTLIILGIICLAYVQGLGAQENDCKISKIQSSQYRQPANFVPSDELAYNPMEQELWIDRALAEDDEGVLRGVKDSIKDWERRDEFNRQYRLQSTQPNQNPDSKGKSDFLKSKALTYADKRLSGEMKRAEKGSTLKKMETVQKAIAPNATVPVSKTIKVKFKARVLQGKAMMVVDNPYVESNTTASLAGKKINTEAAKDLKAIGVRTSVNYDVTEGIWVAALDKKLTETISARISSTQNKRVMAFTSEAERRYELSYAKGF